MGDSKAERSKVRGDTVTYIKVHQINKGNRDKGVGCVGTLVIGDIK